MEAESNSLSDQELLSDQQAIKFMENVLGLWRFAEQDQEANNWFALNFSLWTVEYLGQGDTERGYRLDGAADSDEKIPGADSPLMLQPLITRSDKDGLFLTDRNNVSLRTQYDYILTDHFIPNWEEISAKDNFNDQLQLISDSPDIISEIKLAKAEFLPQIQIVFEPHLYYGWGLEFRVSPQGIKIVPFGKKGETEPAYNFAVENSHRSAELTKTVCELALVACKRARRHARDVVPKEATEVFWERLTYQKEIPIIVGEHYRPAGGLKDLMIERLIEAGKLLVAVKCHSPIYQSY